MMKCTMDETSVKVWSGLQLGLMAQGIHKIEVGVGTKSGKTYHYFQFRLRLYYIQIIVWVIDGFI